MTRSNTSRSLVAYAYLKAGFADFRSPAEVISPLVMSALIRSQTKFVDVALIQKVIEKSWGLSLPQHVIRYVLPKLAATGSIYFDKASIPPSYALNVEQDQKLRYQEKELVARQTYERVSGRVRTELLRAGDMISKPDEIISNFLEDSSISFFPNPRRIASRLDKEDRISHTIIAKSLNISADGNFNTQAVDDLSEIVFGDLLFKAVSSVSELEIEHAPKRMNGVEVYFDTRIVFSLLGMMGERFDRPAREMLEMCIATGCRPKVFEHTIREVEEGLLAVARRSRPFGPIVDYLQENGLDVHDLIRVAENLPDQLNSVGVEIVSKPLIRKEIALSERELEYQIEIDVRQDNVLARQRDVDSLHAIFQLRGGEEREHFEDCASIFVTNNKSLADASDRFFRRFFREERKRNIVQICMTDVVFTSRLWLKVPTRFSNVPRNQVIAHSLAHLRPSAEFRERFLSELERLVRDQTITEEAAQRARVSRFVELSLALSEHEGELANIKEETKNIVADYLSRQKVKLEKLVEARTVSEARRAATELHQARENFNEQYGAIEKTYLEKIRKVEEKAENLLAQHEATDFIANRLSNIIIWAIFGSCIFFFALPLLRYAVPEFSSIYRFLPDSQGYARTVADLLLAVLTVFGLSAFGITRRLASLLKAYLFNSIRDRNPPD